MLGIKIKSTIGIGDALQFSSVPENYFRATGKKLFDVDQPWFFDCNPYVERGPGIIPEKTIEMWNFSPRQYDWPKLREHNVYLSNAEIHASVWKVPVVLNRPRLYLYENFPFEERKKILFHVEGKSHGKMPEHIIQHVLKKYSGKDLFTIGKEPPIPGIGHIYTTTLWNLAKEISQARMLIGVDSGPAWIAACYPDVVVKKVRTKPTSEYFKEWVPLDTGNIHSHWDDRCHQIYNTTEDDIGFTWSYTKI